MHTALWVLAATSLLGAGVCLMRPRHVSAADTLERPAGAPGTHDPVAPQAREERVGAGARA
jgi:hypothetical protein